MIKDFLKGLVFGSVVGGSAGLLLAPQSGNDTRRKLQQNLEEAAATQEDLNRSIENFSASLKRTQSLVTQLVPDLQDSLKKDIEAFQFQAEPRINRIKKQAEVLQDHLDIPETTDRSTKD